MRRPNVAEWHRTTALLVAVDGGAGSRERVIAGLRAGLEIDPTLSIYPGALPENYRSKIVKYLNSFAPDAER